MTTLMLEDLRSELAPITASIDSIRVELAPIKAAVDGIPLMHRTIEVLRQETRALRAAFNDFALTNVTTGEIAALHADVNAVQAKNVQLELEIETLKRLVRELSK